MYVNPFWLGVLMTVLVEIVVLMVIAFINMKRAEMEEEEYWENCKKEDDDQDV